MPYFSYLPNIKLASRPIRFPWSEQQYKTAKNIFRRFTLSDAAIETTTYFKKYTVSDKDRPDLISQSVYGRPDYDWIVMMSNNVVNPYFDWPMTTDVLAQYINEKYDEPYDIKHYVTREVKNSQGDVVLPAGQIVDEGFYRAPYWLEYDNNLDDFPEVKNTAELVLQRRIVVETIQVDHSYTFPQVGVEIAPTIVVEAPDAPNGSLSPVRATGTVNLSSTGTFRRVKMTNGGNSYTVPPTVTFTGGMAGVGATALLSQTGNVTGIQLDGQVFDTTDVNNFYELGNGATITGNGSGTGTSGGFNISPGGTHLRFGESSGTRYATFVKQDSRSFQTVRVYAIRGNGSNGGETPDINGVEDLMIRYQINETEPDEAEWINLGIVIDAVPNGSGSGVLENYDFLLPPEAQSEHAWFQLYQPGNSGPGYDHYGILSLTFIDASIEYADSGVIFTPNETDTTGVGATGIVYLNKRVESVTVTNEGSYDEIGRDLLITMTNSGYDDGPGNANSQSGLVYRTGREVLPVFSATTVQDGSTINPNAEIHFSNGTIGIMESVTMTAEQMNMTLNLQNPDPNNPLSVDMKWEHYNPNGFAPGSGNGSDGIIKEILSTELTEPTYVDKDNNKFRYKTVREVSKTSGWEKLVRDSFRFLDPAGTTITITGDSVARAVTNFDYETELNDKKREIYVLKERFVSRFVEDMKRQLPYKTSSDYISGSLKRSAD